MAEKLNVFDMSQRLTSEEDIAVYLASAFETRDAGYIAHALGVVARSKGMKQVAEESGLSREHLYRSCSDGGNPTLRTLLAVLNSLGLELCARPTVG